MDKVFQALREIDGMARWNVTRPRGGARKECYLARSESQAVFLKFDIAIPPLLRLAALGVAPAVLAHGDIDGVPWVAQEALGEVHPDRPWLRAHAATVGHLIRTYHGDPALHTLLDGAAPLWTVANELASLQDRLAACDRNVRTMVADDFAQFAACGAALAPRPVVPVHDEPNTDNMLRHHDRLLLVDWDDLHLADPLADLGPLLWWYFPEAQWSEILAALDLPLNADIRTGIFWHAARASLTVALWRLEHGRDDGGFLGDFHAASREAPNPRG